MMMLDAFASRARMAGHERAHGRCGRGRRGAVVWSVVLLSLLGGILAGCGRADSGGDDRVDQSRIVVSGSSTIAPLAGEMARRFEARHPGVRVDVQSGGSSRGIADVRRGSADIGMVSRALEPDEGDLTAHPIAIDGIATIVHRDNPVSSLTDQQIAGIFTGRITRWSDTGGADAPITVVNKADGRSTLELFLRYFGLQREAIRAHVVIGDNQHGILTVAGNPHAIGYVSIGTAESESARGVAIRMLPMSGVEPSLANVRNGMFPLARSLNLVTHGARSAVVDAFLAFAASDEVIDLVEAQFFVPITE